MYGVIREANISFDYPILFVYLWRKHLSNKNADGNVNDE